MSVDPPATSRVLAASKGLTFPLVSDVQLAVVRAWGLEEDQEGIAWPAIYVIAPDGRIAWRSLSEVFTERAASEEILKALDALPPTATQK